ncbi:hypothetical protein ACIP1U_30605 [Cupriavidus sp. NPDC089707]|uniref:hypothetical protein n=1 Tax=Cupriavidus sp. NPDC089707 TaxID=3363963 RepID=UPI0038128E9B
MDAYSFFVGYNLGWGEALRLDFTPILGMVTGSTHRVVGGFEATLTGRYADAYVEFEYVPDAEPSGYAYAWSELAWRPRDWLRLGLAAQRTRVPDNGHNLQRGVFAQVNDKAHIRCGLLVQPRRARPDRRGLHRAELLSRPGAPRTLQYG